jgi:tetratricopeptide (TPR) repeat protein
MGWLGERRRKKATAEAEARVAEFLHLRGTEQLHTAESRVRTALEQAVAALGEQHPLTLRLRSLHAWALGGQGRSEEALREYRAVADAAGTDTQGRVVRQSALANLTALLCEMRRSAEAESEARQLLDEIERLPVEGRLYGRLAALNSIGKALVDQDRPAEAEEILRAALAESATGTLPTGNFQRVLDANLASALTAQGRYTEALAALTAAAAIVDPTAPHAGASAVAMGRAKALLGLGRHAEAAEAAQAGLDSALVAFGEAHPRVVRLRALLAEASVAV